METLFIKHGRDWLNEIDSPDTGSVQWSVEAVRYNSDIRPDICASISIRDCSRKVELDFSCHNEKSFKDKMNKLNILISHLEEMKESMEKSYTLCKDEWEKISED